MKKQKLAKLPLKSKLYTWSFPISIILTIIINYFFVSKLNIHPTLQLIISIIIMFIILSLLSTIVYFAFRKKVK